MKHFVIMALLAAVSLSSCSKESEQANSSYDENAESFREINVPEGFDFSGMQTIKIDIRNQEGVSSDARSLITIMNEEGKVLMKYNALLSQDIELSLEVPASTKELYVINAAGVRQAVRISNNRLTIK